MTLDLASLNVKRLRDARKSVHLLAELSNLCIDVAAVQENHFICMENCRMLERDYVVASDFGVCCNAGFSLLIGCRPKADIGVVFAGDGGRLIMANVAVKEFDFRMVTVYGLNSIAERRSLFRQVRPFFTGPKRLGDWNAILRRLECNPWPEIR